VAVVPSDSELIVASLREPEAFAQLFDRHYAAIAGFLRRRLERSLADELASETFLRAFAARDRYDRTRADARPWLFGIASNMLSRARRSEVRRWRALAHEQQAAVTDDELDRVDARLDAAAASNVLADALASLSAGDRDVLLLYAWAELTYEQIADALDIPVGTVRSRLSRARRAVGQQLKDAAVSEPLTTTRREDSE
jgi:RNA polymerase sigma factor (sigma-70 family)